MSKPFHPSTNRQGYSRLTYVGYEIKYGQTVDGKNWSLLCLKFSALSTNAEKIPITVTTGIDYSPTNLLGITLSKLGFPTPTSKTASDDVFDLASIEAEIDVLSYLDTIKGREYLAKLKPISKGQFKGFWHIDINTLNPFVRKATKEATEPKESVSAA